MKINYILISLVAVLAFSSCNNDFDGFGSVKKGDVIRFVATTSDSNTRTSYGDKTTDNKWPIYWENGDNVRVVCPQANQANDTKWADFTVNAIDDKQTEYTLTGANSLSWGEEDVHHFYTFYPTERVYVTDGNTGTYTVAIPREQNAEVTEGGNETDGYIYEAVDMSAAVMAGHAEYKRTAVVENTVINLPFEPLTTAFDIVIKAPLPAPESTTGIESVVITSITIANQANETINRLPLAGGFTYNAKDDSYELYQNDKTNEDAQSYTVNVQLAVPVTLRAGTNDQLTVTAFLLPIDLPKDLRFMVNCRESETSGNMKVQSKTVSITDEQVTANVGKKITLNMGNLPNPIEFSYETWMANLDEDVYVSQISMPGTHDAGAYPTTDDNPSGWFDDAFAQTQDYSIIEQLNLGIRVLDFRPKYMPASGRFNIAHGIITYDDRYFDFVIENALTWLANHPTETIIIILKNEYGTGDATSNSNKDSFFGWMKNINSKLRNINDAYTIKQFDPLMTLKDARGKILFMSRDYYTPVNITDDEWSNVKSDWGTYQNYYTDWFGCKISGWTDNGKFVDDKRFFVTHSGTQNTVGYLYYSDYYNSGTLSYLPKQSDKEEAIRNMLNAAKDNKQMDAWHMTWLNVSGWSLGRPAQTSGVYNKYTSDYITNNISQNNTFEKTGIVMFDWAGNKDRSGDILLHSVVDNNFKGSGPAKKQ